MNRRAFLTGTILAGTAGCLSFEEGTETPSDTATGETSETDGADSPETVGDAALAWTAETMASVDGVPVVGAERVYVHSSDRRLYAFDRDSGERRWRTEIGAPPTGGAASPRPIRDGERVLAVTDGGVVALDRSTGREVWSVDGRGGPLAASPVIGEGVVLYQDGDRLARAVDRRTGALVGQRTFDRPLLAAARQGDTATVVGLTGELGTAACRLRIVSTSDGTGRTTDSLPIETTVERPSYFRVADGVAVTDADSGAVAAFEVATGERLWRREHGTGVTPPVTITDGTVYLKGHPEREVGEMAVDLRTGDPRWQLDLLGRGRCCVVAPAVGPDLAYVANTGDAQLVGVDAEGTVRWRYEGTAVPAARPGVTDRRLFVPAENGGLYAIER